jgi:hypothetical protein
MKAPLSWDFEMHTIFWIMCGNRFRIEHTAKRFISNTDRNMDNKLGLGYGEL